MGLIVESNLGKGKERRAGKVTLTDLGCPREAGGMSDVREHLLEIPGVKDGGVEIVYDPPWTPERMTEDARWELGMA